MIDKSRFSLNEEPHQQDSSGPHGDPQDEPLGVDTYVHSMVVHQHMEPPTSPKKLSVGADVCERFFRVAEIAFGVMIGGLILHLSGNGFGLFG